MPPATEPFDLAATAGLVWHALSAVVCNIGLHAAVAGLFIGCVLGAIGLILDRRGRRAGRPLLAVFKKICLFCVCLGLPGFVSLLASGSLPPVNQLNLNPFGLLGFWALISAHMCMEEMNFEWYFDK